MFTKTDAIAHKIVSLTELKQLVKRWQLKNQKVGFTNGCFDILHVGHIKIINEAASHADRLIVAVNTDKSVAQLKGPSRPINKENDRAKVLAALQFVDAVILFDEETPLELIKNIVPDVLIKGGDYTIETIVGADIVLENKGEVVVIPTEEGYSTTGTIAKINTQ